MFSDLNYGKHIFKTGRYDKCMTTKKVNVGIVIESKSSGACQYHSSPKHGQVK